MIRVRRPARIPAILKKRGAEKTKVDCAAHTADPTTALEFDRAIYGDATVKDALKRAQHDKCAFCESKVTHVASGHVEHFRPKGGYRQSEDAPLERPGYFWLAYVWTNLLFSCELCNSRDKRNQFPLEDPNSRVRDFTTSLQKESPLFLDPTVDDPETHIGFREEYPFAKNGSARGEATWRALGLDREALAERRRDRLEIVRTLMRVAAIAGANRRAAKQWLAAAVRDDAEWAAMTRAATESPRPAGQKSRTGKRTR